MLLYCLNRSYGDVPVRPMLRFLFRLIIVGPFESGKTQTLFISWIPEFPHSV